MTQKKFDLKFSSLRIPSRKLSRSREEIRACLQNGCFLLEGRVSPNRPGEISGIREQTGDEKKNSPVSSKVIH